MLCIVASLRPLTKTTIATVSRMLLPSAQLALAPCRTCQLRHAQLKLLAACRNLATETCATEAPHTLQNFADWNLHNLSSSSLAESLAQLADWDWIHAEPRCCRQRQNFKKKRNQSLAEITQAIKNVDTHEPQHKPKVGGRITNPSTFHDTEFCRYEPRVSCIQLRSSEPDFS